MAEERRAIRTWQVVLLVMGIALLGLRFVRSMNRHSEAPVDVGAGVMDLGALESADAMLNPKQPPAPIEFELVVGDRAIDVDGDMVTLPNGTKLELAPRALRVWRGKRFSFKYPRRASVAGDDKVAIVLGSGVKLELYDVGNKAEDATLSVLAPPAGPVSAAAREIAGKPVAGKRYGSSLSGSEVYAPLIAADLRLGVLLGKSSHADLDVSEQTLRHVTSDALEPEPLFDACVEGGDDCRALLLDEAVSIPGSGGELSVTLRRRASVRRQYGDLTVEHSPKLAASELPLANGSWLYLVNAYLSVDVLHTKRPLGCAAAVNKTALVSDAHITGEGTREIGGKTRHACNVESGADSAPSKYEVYPLRDALVWVVVSVAAEDWPDATLELNDLFRSLDAEPG